jgi:uncharacterized protein (UPF0248 family)
MVLSFVSNLLNRLKWTDRLPESEIVILHRGAPKDRKMIKGDNITEIRKGSFSYMDFDTRKEFHIPMHRVLEIWMDEKVVWKKRAKGAVSNVKKVRTTKNTKPKTKAATKKKAKPRKSSKKKVVKKSK